MNNFYEEDEPAEQIEAAFNTGPHGITTNPKPKTYTYTCPHFTVQVPSLQPPTCHVCQVEMELQN